MRGTSAFVVASTLGALWVASCGARTGLLSGERIGAGTDAAADAGAPDASDASSARDASMDVADAPLDVPADVPPDRPVVTTCDDAGVTYIYLMTADSRLLSFYPPTRLFKNIGTINCPTRSPSAPFSMAVDRAGVAHVVFNDGELFRVSTRDASCTATGFQVGQQGFTTFGMGFSANRDDPGETLYVDQIEYIGDSPSNGLGWIDLDTYRLNYIGPFDDMTNAGGELTGTGDARLYLYFFHTLAPGGVLAELDKATGKTLSALPLPVGDNTSSLAFAYWGGDFYIFTAPSFGSTTVTRYSPAGGSTVTVAQTDAQIVGAGVSTCAPQR